MNVGSSMQSDLDMLSRRRWAVGIGGVFVLQLLLLWLLSDAPRGAVARGPKASSLKVLDFGQMGVEMARQYEVIDPSAFALPAAGAAAGGDVWRDGVRSAEGELGGGAPRWLQLESGWPWARAIHVPEEMTHRNPVDKPSAGAKGPVATPVSVQSRTVVELDPGLAGRGVISGLQAPSLAHTNLLTASEVQVAVESDGSVFSAVLLQGAGWDVADEKALTLARGARFKPLAGTSSGSRAATEWGRIRFRWHIVAPGAGPGGAG